jgi:hypothetical protein
MDKVGCAEKQVLLEKYKIATETYARKVSELRPKTGTIERAEYERWRNRTEESRYLSEHARRELEEHIWDHGC